MRLCAFFHMIESYEAMDACSLTIWEIGMDKKQIANRLNREKRAEHLIIGVAVGAGITAKHAVRGGADLIFVFSSGRFRQMGMGSLAAYLPFANSNQMVMDIGLREVKRQVQEQPLIFGLHATDPMIDLEKYIEKIQQAGFDGINNYPTVGLIDGEYRSLLEVNGIKFEKEVEAIRIASEKGMFTIAFVFDENQTQQMLDAGADVICVHLGLTAGGTMGAKKVLSLENANQLTQRLFAVCEASGKKAMKMIYGGPVLTPVDVAYMQQHTGMDGYIGGSSFERTPTEKAIKDITHAFKEPEQTGAEDLMIKMLDGITKHYEYVEFAKQYVSEHYHQRVSLSELAAIAHVSPSHLSRLFHREVGVNFRTYLIEHRMHQAAKLLQEKPFKCIEVAKLVGYQDYYQFSKLFKKTIGINPREYQKRKRAQKIELKP